VARGDQCGVQVALGKGAVNFAAMGDVMGYSEDGWIFRCWNLRRETALAKGHTARTVNEGGPRGLSYLFTRFYEWGVSLRWHEKAS
jgi:hypothetical protein